MNNIIISEIEGNQAYDPCMADVRYGDTIGGRLFLARKTKGLTLQAVGAELQVRASHLSGVENNKVGVSLDLFRGLLDLYDVSADAILGRPQPPLDDHALGVTEEAEIVADLVDLMPRTKRMEVLDVVRAMAAHTAPDAGGAGPDIGDQTYLYGRLTTNGAASQNNEQPETKRKRKARR